MLLTNLISLYLLVVTVMVVYFAVQIRALNGSGYTRAALLLCFAVCFYILGYTMELNSSEPAQILFWNRIQYIGIPFVSALWLTSGLMYTGCLAHNKKPLLVGIYLIPFLTLILRFTNDYHHLYFASISFVKGFNGLLFMKRTGPWMYVQTVHSALMIFSTMGLFIWDSFRSAERQSGKIVLIVSSSIFAVSGLVLTQLKPFGLQIDYMALFLPVTCAIIIMAITKYDLLETKSIARSKVFEAGGDAILMINRQGRVLDYNNSAKRLFQQIDIRLDNRTLLASLGGNDELIIGLQKNEPSVVKLPIDRGERYFNIQTEEIQSQKTLKGWIKTIRDVTEIHQLNEELNRQAMTDELSVLSNRRAFIKTGKEWILKSEENGSSLHLIMMDLDHFKNVNDQYGHPTGDLVIREFAGLLKNRFHSDCLVARLGGEEFAVLLSGFGDDEVYNMIDTLLKESAEHIYNYYGNQFHVTVSIGLTKRLAGESLEGMMGKADRALYQSKDKGRNCYTKL